MSIYKSFYSFKINYQEKVTIGIRKDLYKESIFCFSIKHSYKTVIGDIKLDVNHPKTECQRYSEYKKTIFTLLSLW